MYHQDAEQILEQAISGHPHIVSASFDLHKNEWRMPCVVCGGPNSNPTELSLKVRDNQILTHCFDGGCEFEDVMAALGIDHKREDHEPEQPKKRPKKETKRPVAEKPQTQNPYREKVMVAEYDHPDGRTRKRYRQDFEEGQPCGRKNQNGDPCGKSGTAHKHCDGRLSPKGCYLKLWGEDTPYKLKGVKTKRTIVIVEGEKAAAAIQGWKPPSYIAASYAGGTSNAEHANYEACRGRHVVVWPDNDSSGHKAAGKVVEQVFKAGAEKVEYVITDDLYKNDDAADLDREGVGKTLKNRYELKRDSNGQVSNYRPNTWDGTGNQPRQLSPKTILNQKSQLKTRMSNWAHENNLPHHLCFDDYANNHVSRLLMYCLDSFLLVPTDRNSVVCVASGPVWTQLNVNNPRCKSAIKHMMIDASKRAIQDLPDDTPPEYAQFLDPALHSSRVLFETIRTIEGYADEMEIADSLSFNDRNPHPIFPFTSGRALDLTTGQVVEGNEVIHLRALDVGWNVPETDITQDEPPVPVLNITNEHTGKTTARKLTQILNDQYGPEVMERLSAQVLGTSKRADVLRMPSDAGKTTLYDMLKRAFPGVPAIMNATEALNPKDGFSTLKAKQATSLWIFIDEATHDTAQVTPHFLNNMDKEEVEVNEKFMQKVELKRVSGHWFLGAEEWPHVQSDGQGFDARFKWVNDRIEKSGKMTMDERLFLLSKKCTDYIRFVILKKAHELWRDHGQAPKVFEAQERHPERKADLAEFANQRTDPTSDVLSYLYVWTGDLKDRVFRDEMIDEVKNSELLDRANLPTKQTLVKYLRKAMGKPNLESQPSKNPESKKTERAYFGIKRQVTEHDLEPEEQELPELDESEMVDTDECDEHEYDLG